MTKFATLLGTYSLNEKEPVISLRHTQPNDRKTEFTRHHGQLEKLLIAASCNALRGMISSGSHTASSFPALVLNSFGWGQVAPDMEQKEQVGTLASFFLGRPIIFSPPSRVNSTKSSGEYDTTQEIRSENYENLTNSEKGAEGKGIERNEVESKKRAAADSNHIVEIKRHRKNDKSKPQLEVDSDVLNAIQTVEDIARVPFLMMSNFSSSFALLIEARLRAYGNILKRHIATFSHDRSSSLSSNGSPQHDKDGVDRSFLMSHGGCPMATQMKLNTLVAIGEHMEVNGVVTTFHVQKGASVLFHTSWREINNVDDNILTLPITFEAIVDISIPRYSQNEWQSDKVTVSVQTPGTITGCYKEGSHSLFTQVHVQLDTYTLVTQMINKACDVVLKSTDNANAAISDLKHTTSRPQQDDDKDDLQPEGKSSPCSTTQLTDSAPALPIQRYTMVTPEFKPRTSTVIPPEFALDDGKKNISLTKDGNDKDCASIIDYAIGNFTS